MIALVSGSHGFIGSHVVERLLKEKIEVVPLDRTWLNSTKLQEFVEQLSPDLIFHCGAYGNMSHQKDENEIMVSNIFGTYNLLHSIKNVDFKACVLFGSSSEYGSQKKMSELTLPTPETLYAATKLSATFLGQAFAKIYNKPIVTVRPFSVYGGGEASFRFIPSLLRAQKTGEPFTLTENIRHDWIYIDDLIQGVLEVADHAQQLMGQVVNLGTGIETYNSEILLKLWPDYKGKLPKKSGGHWKADITKALTLGWSPKVTLEKGLKKTQKFYDT